MVTACVFYYLCWDWPTVPANIVARLCGITRRRHASALRKGGLFLECISPIRYLLDLLQMLPAGTISCRVGFAPTGFDKPFTAH